MRNQNKILKNFNVRAPAKARGTTLLEVLVALLVLMLGFLGVAVLQSFSLSNNHSAFLRSQAVIQAHDMSDRMYANTTGVADGGYGSISGIPNSPPVCATTAAPGSLELLGVDCTPTQMATYDAWEWNTTNASFLPSGAGTVTGPDGNGIFIIGVSWLEQEAGAPATKTFNFQVKPLP